MKKYEVVEINEKQLEELVRISPDLIEDGLRYVDHQKRTDRGPLDVLLADSGNSLVVAELKVVEDDSMLVQGIDYYDYIAVNIEGFARAYKDKKIDPTQKPRLFLIAPSFSVSILNRCKWIDIPISLFIFQCIAFEDDPKNIIPIFKEVNIPSIPAPPPVYTVDQKLSYITDGKVRKMAEELLEEIQEWDKDNILIEALKYDISIKVSGKAFAYLAPRRRHVFIYTFDSEDKWTGFRVEHIEDLKEVKILINNSYGKIK